MVLRVIFDTNIFGHLVDEPDGGEIEDKIVAEKDFVVYDYRPIRKELRDIPTVNPLSKRTRVLLLTMYDRVTGKHHLEDSDKIQELAKRYHDQYRKFGGTYGWHTSIKVDFMIIACASINGLDLVCSADNKTLLADKAQEAYDHVNIAKNLRTPKFLKYEDLLKKFRGLL
jgi:hypothetical protein